MQFETLIRAKTPRCRCKDCGVKTIPAPWASGKHARFTLLFEAFAIEVLQHSSSVQDACKILKIDWHTADQIMERAVDRGLDRRSKEVVPYIGVDEKSYKKRHSYVTVMSDLLEGRVLDVVQDRTKESTDKLFETLSETQRVGVAAVSMDFWQAFITSAEKKLPQALIVHDRFHISKYLNDAVDKVRRWEKKQLKKTDDSSLIGSKFAWLQNVENMTQKRLERFRELLQMNLKTGEAWAMKNLFHEFWDFTDMKSAAEFFESWKISVEELGLKAMNDVADMLDRHITNILTFFIYPISNGVAEGLNSKIQIVKSAARGLRSFESYRRRILFFCGKLNMKPDILH